ncbi:MAG: SDR family oxidoreductase [Acidobacteriota bacterium]|jgi:NAD(P)-dependent dehydrogenase (short-subunit alcohol dehydrogenase family)
MAAEPGPPSLQDRRALVTGGAGAIGSAVVRSLSGAGARVASADLPGSPPGSGAASLEADLREPGAVAALVEEADRRLGGLDILVHCAGITRDAVLWKMSPSDWSEVIRVNLDSAFHLLREATPRMRRGSGGAIVLVASINGERGKFGQSNYAASKAGLIGLARSAARELGRFDIRVNVIAPGWIDTPMTAAAPPEFRQRAIDESALGRVGRPEDVADGVLFLVSGLSRHVTGQVLRVDGGQLIG